MLVEKFKTLILKTVDNLHYLEDSFEYFQMNIL